MKYSLLLLFVVFAVSTCSTGFDRDHAIKSVRGMEVVVKDLIDMYATFKEQKIQ